jgi:hypothetical protein
MHKYQRSFITAAAFAVCISAVSVSSALAWLQPGSPPSRPAKTAWTIDDNTLTEGAIREGLAAPTTLRVLDAGNDADALVSWACADQQVTEFIIHRQRSIAGRWLDFGKLRLLGRQLSLQDTPGLGTFRYRVASATPTGNSAYSDWAAVDVQRNWTVFTPSPDTRTIYVSSSSGNDANSGLTESAPKRTIAAGYGLARDGFPDWVLLKRGDTWNETLNPRKSGRSESERLILGSYGTSPDRPVLQSGTATAIILGSIRHVAFVGISLVANTYDGRTTPPSGIFGYGNFLNVLIEDCKIASFKDGVVLQADRRVNTAAAVRNLVLRRSVIIDSHCATSHAQGIFVDGYDGVTIEECIFDSNGFKDGVAAPSIFNHNIYANSGGTNLVVRNSVLSRPASHSLQARAGGIIENNLVLRAPIGILIGGGDSPVAGGVTGNVTGNVILMGTNIDANNPRGFGIDLKNLRSAVINRNIIADKFSTGNHAAIGSYVSGGPGGVGVQNTRVEDNVISNWAGNLAFGNFSGDYYSGTVYQRNRIVFDGSKFDNRYVYWTGAALPTFAGNIYQGQRATQLVFANFTTLLNFSGWQARVGDVGAVMETTPITSPFVFNDFCVQQNIGSDVFAYLATVRNMSRSTWRADLMPGVINAAARSAYGVPER